MQLIKCFEVRSEDRGHDERTAHESFNRTAAPRRSSQFDPRLYFDPVQVGRLTMQQISAAGIQAPPATRSIQEQNRFRFFITVVHPGDSGIVEHKLIA